MRFCMLMKMSFRVTVLLIIRFLALLWLFQLQRQRNTHGGGGCIEKIGQAIESSYIPYMYIGDRSWECS